FGFNGSVRNRDGLTQIGRGQFFTVEHRFNIFRLNVAAIYQLLTREANGFFFGGSGTAQEDVLGTQFEEIIIAFVETVFQTVTYFYLLALVALSRDPTLGQTGVQATVEEVGQRNMLRLRHLTHRTFGQVAVGDDQVNIRRQ